MGMPNEPTAAFACTLDGMRVELAAEAHCIADVERAFACHVRSIAPLCSEELFLSAHPAPDEDALYDFYRAVLEYANGARVIARICDFRGKRRPRALPMPRERNPAMGLCSVRLLLSHSEWFVPHLRALLRASVHGRLAILTPMLSTVDEVLRTRALLSDVRASLTDEGIPTADTEFGVSIETPSAVIVSDLLARYADFFWIDLCNLTQYALVTDRSSMFYSPIEARCKAVLRLVDETVQNGRREGVWCGATAGAPEAALTPLLAALGVSLLSAPPTGLDDVRRSIHTADIARLRTELIRELASARDFDAFNNKS